jgi:hypothetical protein
MSKNFIDLKGQPGQPGMLHRWLGVSLQELDQETAGEIINIVRRRFCRLRESKFGEHTDSFQTRVQIRDYPLPAGWSKPRDFWYQDPTNLDDVVWIHYVLKSEFDATYPTSGLGTAMGGPVGGGPLGATNLGDPTIYTAWAGQIQLGAIPNRVFTIFRNYWRIPPDLTDAQPEDDFTRLAWEYLLFKGLVTASEFGFEDERVGIWERNAADIEKDLTIEDARSRTTALIPVSQEPG